MKLSQTDQLLTHMCQGNTVTRLEALYNWHVQNITARIVDLRDAGITVETHTKTDPNGREYAEYSISDFYRGQALADGLISETNNGDHQFYVIRTARRKAA